MINRRVCNEYGLSQVQRALIKGGETEQIYFAMSAVFKFDTFTLRRELLMKMQNKVKQCVKRLSVASTGSFLRVTVKMKGGFCGCYVKDHSS